MCLTMCRGQSPLAKETDGWTKCPVLQEKDSWEKSLNNTIQVLSKKNKSRQTSGSLFAGRIQIAKKTKFELDLIKIVDCFPDVQGIYDSNLVSFQKIFITNIFLLQFLRVMSVPKEFKILMKNEIPNQKKSSLVRFQIKFFTTRQIVKQKIHNVSDFKSSFLKRVRL